MEEVQEVPEEQTESSFRHLVVFALGDQVNVCTMAHLVESIRNLGFALTIGRPETDDGEAPCSLDKTQQSQLMEAVEIPQFLRHHDPVLPRRSFASVFIRAMEHMPMPRIVLPPEVMNEQELPPWRQGRHVRKFKKRKLQKFSTRKRS